MRLKYNLWDTQINQHVYMDVKCNVRNAVGPRRKIYVPMAAPNVVVRIVALDTANMAAAKADAKIAAKVTAYTIA